MPDRKASPPSNSSRTVAKVAVAILIVIAVAGFVLAGLRAGTASPEQAAAADATQEPAAQPTGAVAPVAAAAASAEEAAVPPNMVAFAPSSTKLSDKELAKVRTMAETAKTKSRAVEIISTVEESQFGLAQQRATVIRQTLVDGGVPLARMSIKISRVPQGAISATDANRLLIVLQ
jgi:outer membrane protein OmpA-like peptidoglycan-associated protein